MSLQFGRYQVQEELGRGGMGVVYRAWRPDLERSFAIKTLTAGEDASPELLHRFAREARAAASLAGHPNVVAVHDVGRAGNQCYIVMDYVKGPSLKELIEKEGLTMRRALTLAEGVARGLEAAHARGIIHRDVKPHNILIDPSGVPKLTDFGLAKNLEDEEAAQLTRTGMMVGTPAYMSPEQAEGAGADARLDKRTDIYSLGAVLYEMLTNRPPFEGNTTLNVLKSVLVDDPLPPRHHNRGIPRDVENICLMALERDPERRYASAAAMAEDLSRAKVGLPVEARTISLPRRAYRFARRNRMATTISLVLLLLISTASVMGWLRYREWQEQIGEARSLARSGDHYGALARYETLLKDDPSDRAAARGMIDVAEARAAEAAAVQDFEELDRLAARLRQVAEGATPTLEESLVAKAEALEDLRLGEGTLTMTVASDDPRANLPFHLYDVRDRTLERLPPLPFRNRRYETGDYVIFSVQEKDGQREVGEQFIVRIEREKERTLDLRTVHLQPSSDENPAPLTTCLAGDPEKKIPAARPGWRIVLHGSKEGKRRYLENPVVTTPHLRILGAPDDGPAILDGGGRGSCLVVLKATDVTVRNLQIAGARTRAVEVQASRHVTLDRLRIGGGRNVGIFVWDSRSVAVQNTRFGLVPGLGYQSPLVGIRYHRCTGGAVQNIVMTGGFGVHRRGIVVSETTGLVVRNCRIDHVNAKKARIGNAAILVRDSDLNLFSRNRCSNKRFYGIEIGGSSTGNQFRGNVCRNNRRAGIRIATPGSCFLAGNVLEGNDEAGVEITAAERIGHWDPNWTNRRYTLRENILHRNGVGIRVRGTRQVNMRGNWITENRRAGLELDTLDDWTVGWPRPGATRWTREGPFIWADHDIFHKNGLVGIWINRKVAELSEWRRVTKTEKHGRKRDPGYEPGRMGEVWLPELDLTGTPWGLWPIPYERALLGNLSPGETAPIHTLRFAPREKDQAPPSPTETGLLVDLPRGGPVRRLPNEGIVIHPDVGEEREVFRVPLPNHGAGSFQTVRLHGTIRPAISEGDDPIVLEWQRVFPRDWTSRFAPWKSIRASELTGDGVMLSLYVPAFRSQELRFRTPAAVVGSSAWDEIRIDPIEVEVGVLDLRGDFLHPDYDAKEVEVTVPEKAHAGSTFPVSVRMRNTGATPWVLRGVGIRMAWFGTPTELLRRGEWRAQGLAPAELGVVLPGEVMTFEGRASVGLRLAPLQFAWRMRAVHDVAGGNRNFGDIVRASVEVVPGPDYQTKLKKRRRALEGKLVLPLGRQGWQLVREGTRFPLHEDVQRELWRSGFRDVSQVDPFLLKPLKEGPQITDPNDPRLPN